MRSRILAALAAVCVFTLLLALPVNASEPDGWNRSGPYIGLVGGYNAAEMKAEDFKFSDGKLFAGGLAGFNQRLPNAVIGVEADYLFIDVKASRTEESVTVTATSNYLASVRARVGVPLGPMLLFVTAGPAFTNQKLFATDGEEQAGGEKKMLVGAALGGGVEAELTKALFVRVEGLHYIFPDKSVPLGEDTVRTSNQQTLFRAALGFKF